MLNNLIIDLSSDPFDPEKNFEVALEYESLNQYASAMSFYLRAAEYGYVLNMEIAYTSLLKLSMCLEKLQERQASVINSLLQAIAYVPDRPEAYFLLSRTYERMSEWQLCYTFAELGLTKAKNLQDLPVSVDYNGKYCLEFEKAVSGWWIGRKEESKKLLESLLTKDIPEDYKKAVEYNLLLIK